MHSQQVFLNCGPTATPEGLDPEAYLIEVIKRLPHEGDAAQASALAPARIAGEYRAARESTWKAGSGVNLSMGAILGGLRFNQEIGMRKGLSAKANPCHEVWTESFMGTLKAEMLQDDCFINAHDARTGIFACIDSYCNSHRKHSALGYQTPTEFEAQIPSLN